MAMLIMIMKNRNLMRILLSGLCFFGLSCSGLSQDRKAFLVGNLADFVELNLETLQITRSLDFADTLSGAGMGAVVDPQNQKIYLYSFIADSQKYASLVRLGVGSLVVERKLFLPEYADTIWHGFIEGYLTNQGQRLFLVFNRATPTSSWYEGWLLNSLNFQTRAVINIGNISELAYDEPNLKMYYVDYLKDSKPLYRIDVSTEPLQTEVLTENLNVSYDRKSGVMIFANGSELWYASDYLYRINLTDLSAEKIFNAPINTQVKAFTSDRCKLVVNKRILDLNNDSDSLTSNDTLTVINFGQLLPQIERYIKIPTAVDTSVYALKSIDISPDGEFLVLIYYDKLEGRGNEDVLVLEFATGKKVFHQVVGPMLMVRYNYTGPTGPCPQN